MRKKVKGTHTMTVNNPNAARQRQAIRLDQLRRSMQREIRGYQLDHFTRRDIMSVLVVQLGILVRNEGKTTKERQTLFNLCRQSLIDTINVLTPAQKKALAQELADHNDDHPDATGETH